MDPGTALLHLANFVAAPLVVGLLSAAATKLLWRRALGGIGLARLALMACGAGLLASIGGLLLLGRDGAMATYAAMIVATAAALLLAGLGRR